MSLSLVKPIVSMAPNAVQSWRWIHIVVAALLMVATLPGRTHGLGLFTEPILRTFGLTRDTYGFMNLWATLIGATFCFPCGWFTDRIGTRAVAVVVMLLLAATVFGLSLWTGGLIGLFIFILLTRGLGQSALSVGSLTLLGKSVSPKSGMEMAVYSCLISIGFFGAFGILRQVVKSNPEEWRTPWAGIGVGVLVIAALSVFLIRESSLVSFTKNDDEFDSSKTFSQAIKSYEFWIFALGTSFYGMISSGISLFNESILSEQGFAKEIFLNATVIGIPIGLLANLTSGWLVMKFNLIKVFSSMLTLLTVTLAFYPFLHLEWEVYLYTCLLAASGGGITVCFFTVWKQLYGVKELGRIQGAAQFLTVLGSAAGPSLFAYSKSQFATYVPMFLICIISSMLLVIASWVVSFRMVDQGIKR